MLSKQTINIIKSTVPVLETHGEEITGRFYDLMFQAHPELLNMFNQTNQKKKTQRTALAAAVYAAAANIDQLENIIPVVKMISHKHRSIGVKPEHYPIVGTYLLKAIKDVLGDKATPDIMQAWETAYGVIADAFIGIEKDMYQHAGEQKGGWIDYKRFLILKKTEESKEITSFYLQPADGQSLPPFEAGQYISVRVRIPGSAYTHIRQYSLSDAFHGNVYRISVKKDGVVSTYLHDQLEEGDSIEVSAPAGDFVLNDSSEKPLVLISAGVGITPMMSMLHTAVKQQPERHILFIHAAKNSEHHAFRQETEEVAKDSFAQPVFIYSEPTNDDYKKGIAFCEGRIDKILINRLVVNPQADYYVCGSEAFMAHMQHLITTELGAPADSIHVERFGPQLSMKAYN
ncbi:NO-inducible flavohemoprotein [Bacillus atrophaeus]|uniref:NO-inducible flavohemoprotein n=1 Tax=Bacillus atrophaeus TaxID=1452 RepID=UPI00077A7C13|nr:NO-inducible flavohemoprotein [Bacillus atrophaeus]KXZ16356.1 nitric oxide dioxygenase [Bacillus atrophaeus]MCY8837443.1 NO-inducible flavohemoprotein [Bacillus atrophaeus]MEC5220171.1 NO-inducible flavohemoprotein [Bacillus atrophaeus]MED4581059.1 NO-inducible flavohemoprotein [Bacillus atrophaeus]MED4720806.1 NO-inducible flavohemoprotein [Bacillus atrophaeus]